MNTRQIKFCREYILDGNATRAATDAGYSAKTAYQIGSRLLNNVEIKKAVEQMRKEANAAADAIAFLTFREKRQRLKEITIDPDTSTKDVMKAIEIDNSMAGDNAPSRMDVTTGNEPIRPIIHFTRRKEEARTDAGC